MIRTAIFAKPRTGSFALRALALGTVLLAFICAVAWHTELPGLYMDAVNPDYMSVDVLRGVSPDAPIWYLPGNLLFGRIPLLTSFYHGTLNLWLALPFVALFGPGVTTLRFAQASAGVAILALLFLLLRSPRARWPWLAWLATAALALDPVFVYAFRTQLYIQLCPVALLFAALASGTRAFPREPGIAPTARNLWLLLAGLCYGLSIFGYFIFAFFAPVLFGALLRACRRAEAPLMRSLAWTGLGCAIGMSGYALGYCWILQARGGVRGFVEYFSSYQQSLGAFETHRSLSETPAYFANLIYRVFSNDWQHSLMFGEATPQPAYLLKLFLLLALPLLLWLVCELRGRRSWLLRLGVALGVSYPLVGLLFGDRLSGHHFVALLPLAYLTLAAGLITISHDARAIVPAKPAAALVLLVLIAIDLAGLRATGTELLRTHGRGLFSDAINRFAEDANALPDPGRHYFVMPDWGLFMPFHFLTGARIAHSPELDPQQMRDKLCQGKHVTVALINGDVASRLRELTDNLRAADPAVSAYRDHEGKTVFTSVRFDRFASEAIEQDSCAAPSPASGQP